MHRVLVVVALVALVGCSATASLPGAVHGPAPVPATTRPAVTTPPSSSPSTARPSTTRPASRPTTTAPRPTPTTLGWVLGAHPLPLEPNGTGEVLPTPPALVDRQLPTVDLLPPPADGHYQDTIGPITAAIRARMGQTWEPGCPVGLSQLRYVTVSFRGFDHKAHTGELVVNAMVAANVVKAFAALFAAGFPIEEMRLPTTADLDAKPTGDGNDTASYVCRPTRGSTVWSAHAYGLAIDVNPFQNPYSKGSEVLPERASSYLDRAYVRPGMILPGGIVVRAFAAIGWGWGGSWHSPVDRMHMTATGR